MRPLPRVPNLMKVTAFVHEGYPGLAIAMPPSGVAYLVGLVHGRFPEDERIAENHLRAMDSAATLAERQDRGMRSKAMRLVLEYLKEHKIAEYSSKWQRRGDDYRS